MSILAPMAMQAGGVNAPVGAGLALPLSDATALLKNAGDSTKLFRVNLGGLVSGTTRLVTPPSADGQLVTTADISALADLLYLDRTSGTDKSYNIPADTLASNGVACSFIARGRFGTAANLRLTIGGTLVNLGPGIASPIPGGGEGDATWEISGELVRVSATSISVSAKAVIQGQDADVGSALETYVLDEQTIAVADLAANTLAVVVDYNSVDASRRVKWLMIRRVGVASAGSGGASGFGPWVTAASGGGTFAGNTTYTTMYRREGDCARVRTVLTFSAAPTPALTNLDLDLPDGLVVDTAKLTPGFFLVGNANLDGPGAVSYQLLTVFVDPVIRLYALRADSTWAVTGGGSRVQSAQPAAILAGHSIQAEYLVPIVGWSV